MTTSYLSEFSMLAVLHALVLIGPGANFTLIAKNSLTLPPRFGFLTAFGIALGTGVYVIFALFGLDILFELIHSVAIFSAIKLLGAGYLVYIGVRSCRAQKSSGSETNAFEGAITNAEAVYTGLFSQLSNPKAILFFISLFTQVVSVNTPFVIKMGYGLWMFTVTFVWFSLVVYLLSFMGVRHRLRDYLHHISVAFGFLLIFLGALLAFSVFST